ncbi:aminotransferase class I/II-fold pyridoxal phosphate-dependent enzyme [Nonomuraea turkmeniaca]|uniref:aminotransferase class I/II-fold pyridoxal phosphate-dependent enzyme n=1 Tax=Nonomuraea turkmeniaca TaxID=103838 RepID=UPI0014771C52|nr:aminotransferase class I/II-fold pyridoxal phosphate-dependent enzyme [Nonomuraea turkmeniaca]
MTWPQQVGDLLHPLEDYTRLHAATLRRHGGRVLDLSFPNPRFLHDARPYEVLAELAARTDPLDLRYSPFGGYTSVRLRIAAALARAHDQPYTWKSIIMTAGATAALSVTLRTLFTPPERVMLITPCWMDYPLYLAERGLGCDLVPAAGDKRLDLAAIEHAWTPLTRALIISQPVSPTGIVYRDEELRALATLLQQLSPEHPAVLIADEAHRDQVWATTSCPAPAAHYPHTITVYSFGKAWQMPGQRAGYIATSPQLAPCLDAPRRLEQGMRLTGHAAPAALLQHLAAALCDVSFDLTGLADLQRHARGELAKYGVDVLPGDATRFVYARCPTGDLPTFVSALAQRGVLVLPSTVFHEPGWFRISLNTPEPEMSQAARIISEVAHA